jgi:hypothetical protein
MSKRDEYLAALALPTADVSAPSYAAKRAALERAHKLRQFEIENYWKRATYFWAFQLAAFTLLGLLWGKILGEAPRLQENVLLVPAGLGAITGLVGWMTARGSKFWQENWECHVDMLEGELEGRLTQVIFNRGSAKFSVSRTNEKLLLVLTTGWFTFFIVILGYPWVSNISEVWQRLLALTGLVLACVIVIEGSHTRLNGASSCGGKWKRVSSPRFWNRLRSFLGLPLPKDRLVLRDTFAGHALVSDAAPAEGQLK